MAYATHLDVARELGRTITDDDPSVDQINAWIKAVEVLIRKRLGPLDQLDADALAVVIPQVVARRVRNPEGKQNERIDDYSYGLTAEAASVDLMLTPAEWELLTPDNDPWDDGAFTITPYGARGGGVLDTERNILRGRAPWL